MQGFVVAKTTISKPRVAVLKSIVAAGDALLSLKENEQLAIVEIVGQLDRALQEYEGWPEAIAGARGSLPLSLPDGTVRLARDVSTEQMLDTLWAVMENQIGVLVLVLNNSSEKALSQGRLRALWRALQPIRRDWHRKQQVEVAVRSPEVDELTEQQKSDPLVVWVHGKSQYPRPVIELKHIVEEGSSAS